VRQKLSASGVRLLVLFVLTLAPRPAGAFCRQKTCETDDCLKDSLGCVTEGDDLFYDVPCFSFAVDEGSAEPLGVSDQELIDIIADAFRRWHDVTCPGGEHPSFDVQSAGVVPARGIFFCEEESLNVNVWTLDRSWDYEPSSLGYTTSTFVVGTGEVYDADVQLNLSRIDEIVPEGADPAQALLSVALHEAGHFLGLAHSNDDSAVMATSYRDLRPRALTSDDIAGICDIYPPSSKTLECSLPGVAEAGYDWLACEEATGRPSDQGGCSLGPGRNLGTRSSRWYLVAFGLLLSTRLGRRRPR